MVYKQLFADENSQIIIFTPDLSPELHTNIDEYPWDASIWVPYMDIRFHMSKPNVLIFRQNLLKFLSHLITYLL